MTARENAALAVHDLNNDWIAAVFFDAAEQPHAGAQLLAVGHLVNVKLLNFIYQVLNFI